MKQQAPDFDPKAIQQINFTRILSRAENAKVFSIIEEVKETILDFSQRTVTVLYIYFALIQYQYKMTQYSPLAVKLSNLQLNKLKSGIKNGIGTTLNLPSNVVGGSDYETNFPHKLSLPNTQVLRLS